MQIWNSLLVIIKFLTIQNHFIYKSKNVHDACLCTISNCVKKLIHWKKIFKASIDQYFIVKYCHEQSFIVKYCPQGGDKISWTKTLFHNKILSGTEYDRIWKHFLSGNKSSHTSTTFKTFMLLIHPVHMKNSPVYFLLS